MISLPSTQEYQLQKLLFYMEEVLLKNDSELGHRGRSYQIDALLNIINKIK